MNSGVSLLAKTAFFNDVTITSSLRSVMKVLMGHFTIYNFSVTRIVRIIMKSCLNLSKLRPKYCRSLFSGHGGEYLINGKYLIIVKKYYVIVRLKSNHNCFIGTFW